MKMARVFNDAQRKVNRRLAEASRAAAARRKVSALTDMSRLEDVDAAALRNEGLH